MAKRVAKTARECGILAQLGEHLPYKQRVTGSSPVGPTLQQEAVAEMSLHIPEITEYGGIAQLARAHGSYPWCRWFKSSSRYEGKVLKGCYYIRKYLITSMKCNLWVIAKAEASVKGRIAFCAGFLYIQNRIAHPQSGKSFAGVINMNRVRLIHKNAKIPLRNILLVTRRNEIK